MSAPRVRRGDPAALAELLGPYAPTEPPSADAAAKQTVHEDDVEAVDQAQVERLHAAWPGHEQRREPWRQTVRGGTRDDRTLDHVLVMLPPHIADLAAPDLAGPLVSIVERAIAEVSALDQSHGAHLDALATLLLRTESVASSKIEQEEASVDDFARALHGIKANSSATSMVASTRALDLMIRSVQEGQEITLEAILDAHGALMADDPTERQHAGRVRSMQNWIGGSDFSPRNALYVPPPPDTVDDYLEDLITFANRTDLPVLPQAAIAHAQFESIHPFTDGNGRIGRALVNTILRKRGVTRRTVVPIASALVARRDDYFTMLTVYRRGDVGPIIAGFANAAAIAARESQTSATRIAEMPDEWRSRFKQVRAGSALASMLSSLPQHPVFTADDALARTGRTEATVYRAINALTHAEVVRSLTSRLRNQIWGATDILVELEDLGGRIASAATSS